MCKYIYIILLATDRDYEIPPSRKCKYFHFHVALRDVSYHFRSSLYIYIIFNFIKNSLKIFSNILRKLDPIELPNNTFNSLNTDIINTFDGWKN